VRGESEYFDQPITAYEPEDEEKAINRGA
jgi:hypothetical protein